MENVGKVESKMPEATKIQFYENYFFLSPSFLLKCKYHSINHRIFTIKKSFADDADKVVYLQRIIKYLLNEIERKTNENLSPAKLFIAVELETAKRIGKIVLHFHTRLTGTMTYVSNVGAFFKCQWGWFTSFVLCISLFF